MFKLSIRDIAIAAVAAVLFLLFVGAISIACWGAYHGRIGTLRTGLERIEEGTRNRGIEPGP